MAERARPGLAALILLVIFGTSAALWPRLATLGSRPVDGALAAHAPALTARTAAPPTAVPDAGALAGPLRQPRARAVRLAGSTRALPLSAWSDAAAPQSPAAVLADAALDARPAFVLAALPSVAPAAPAPAPGIGHRFARAGRSLASAFVKTGDAFADAFQK
ncbi:MAG: hypothetical protein AB7H88_16220 [Vicinamibacterales bacterium]